MCAPPPSPASLHSFSQSICHSYEVRKRTKVKAETQVYGPLLVGSQSQQSTSFCVVQVINIPIKSQQDSKTVFLSPLLKAGFHPPFRPSIQPPTNFLHPLTNRLNHPLTPSIHLSPQLSTHPLTAHPCTQLLTHRSTHPPKNPSIHPSTIYSDTHSPSHSPTHSLLRAMVCFSDLLCVFAPPTEQILHRPQY